MCLSVSLALHVWFVAVFGYKSCGWFVCVVFVCFVCYDCCIFGVFCSLLAVFVWSGLHVVFVSIGVVLLFVVVVVFVLLVLLGLIVLCYLSLC